MKKRFTMQPILLLMLAWLCLNSYDIQAQDKKTNEQQPPASITATKSRSQEQTSTTEEIRNRRKDPATAQQQSGEMGLLIEKKELERKLTDPSLSSQERASIQAQIDGINGRLGMLNPKPVTETVRKAPSQEPLPVLNVEDFVLTEPSQVKAIETNKVFLTLDQFNKKSFEDQQFILRDPNQYTIVKTADLLPKYTISRAEFNKMPADKQKGMMESNRFTITD